MKRLAAFLCAILLATPAFATQLPPLASPTPGVAIQSSISADLTEAYHICLNAQTLVPISPTPTFKPGFEHCADVLAMYAAAQATDAAAAQRAGAARSKELFDKLRGQQ